MATDLPIIEQGVAAGFPQVKGRCPACGWTSLFLAVGGYITCASLLCPDPTAASDLLERDVRRGD